MIYGDVPPGDSAKRDGAHQVPNIAQGGDGVAVQKMFSVAYKTIFWVAYKKINISVAYKKIVVSVAYKMHLFVAYKKTIFGSLTKKQYLDRL